MKPVLEQLKKLRAWLAEKWTLTEKRDKTRFFVIAGIALILLVGAVWLLNSGKYEEFMTNDDTHAVGTVAAALGENGISYKLQNGNRTIMIDKNHRERAVALVSQLDLGTLSFDYSIFQRGEGIFGSESEKKMYAKYQLEDDMRKVLRQYEGVADAAVTLNMPSSDRAMYERELRPQTAAVMLRLKPGYTLSKQQVAGIEGYVAGATGIEPANISLMDSQYTPLNLDLGESFANVMSDNFAFTKLVEKSYEDAVLKLVGAMVGFDHVRVSASATLNFDDHQTEKLTFVPIDGNEGIVRSMQEVKENAAGRPSTGGEPGVDEDGGGDTYAYVEDGMYSDYSRSDVTTNWEISEVREQINSARGALEDLTISVVIDSDNLAKENANAATIQAIVGGSVGLEKNQYSRITVAFQKFDGVAGEIAAAEAYNEDIRRAQLFELIRVIALYAVIALCIILLVWRTLSLFKPKRPEPEPVLAGADGDYLVGDIDEYAEMVNKAMQGVEIGITKTAARERVEEFIEKNPQAVADMLRNWLGEETRQKW